VTPDALLVTIFFLVPGFFAVQVFRFLLVEDELSTFELTTWSVVLSVLGALALVATPWTREAVAYVSTPGALASAALPGVLLQLAASTLIAALTALAIKRWLGGRLGSSSFFRRSWDYLWALHGRERRFILVELDGEVVYGVLYFADGATAGRDLVVENPYVYDVDRNDFYSDGSKYMFIRGSRVQAVRLMVAEPPTRADEPMPQLGYLRAQVGAAMMHGGSEQDGDEPASTEGDREQEGPQGSG
jgi:hypothetical protein